MKPVLLLVDLQEDFLAASELQPRAPHIVARAASFLDECRRRRIPIIHVWTHVPREPDRRLPHWRRQNRWICTPGTPGYQTPAPLRPAPGETIVHKTGFNAFQDGSLRKTLEDLAADTVLIAGVHLHACVRMAATESLERGLSVLIAEDATGSDDPVHTAATRRWLSHRCVIFEPVQGILARVDGRPSTLIHRSPRNTTQALFEVPVQSASDASAAVQSAQSAFASWQFTALETRLAVVRKIADLLVSAAAALARQMAIEIGKPIRHGEEEVRRAAENLRDVALRAARVIPVQEPAGISRRRPIGVITLISPWNNPVAIPIGKIGPALAYGNTVVWKPSPAATQIARALLAMLAQAGVPANAVQLITGDHTSAQALADQRGIGAVTFTGALQGGYAIQEICARRMTPLQAELSGNNASVIWTDADLRAAATQAAWGALAFAGQRCTANRRVIVHESQADEAISLLKSAGECLPWGDPLESGTEIGPVISTGKRDEIRDQLELSSEGNSRRIEWLHAARARESWTQSGAYAQPAIIRCESPDDPLVQDETMGPLLIVQPARDFDHAISLVNGVRHGLAASLFSASSDLQRRFLDAAEAGVIKFNSSTAGVSVALPFGGWKASGVGPPEHGDGDVLFYTRLQAVYGADSLAKVT